MAEGVEGVGGGPGEGGGELGLGLSQEAEGELVASIGLMFGFPMLMDAREEEAEWNPDEGIA